MKPKRFACFCIIALECSFMSFTSAEPLELEIIESQEVDLGDRSITYNLVEPPVVTEPVVITLEESQLSVSAQDSVELQAGKKQVVMELSATVYDRQFTELRWTHEGREYHAFSNVDFNYLRAVDQFETADAVFTMAFGIGDENTASMTALERAKLPLVSQFNTTKAEFKLVNDGLAIPAEAVAGLTALHAYFSANKQSLLDQYNADAIKQEAYTQWLKAHPPVIKDTVINFWPEQNNYLQKVGIILKGEGQ